MRTGRPEAPPVPAQAGGPGGRTLTGRTEERAELERAVRSALRGAGRTVVVEGEPGIGKTSLAAHAAALAREAGVAVVWARASEGPGSPPWWLWEQVLDALPPGPAAPAGPGSGAAALRRLVEAGTDEDADRARFRLCQALVERVDRAAREEPLLVVLDDLQWADDGTLQAVRLLAQQLSRMSCSLVLTARTGAGRSAVLDATLAAVGREESAGRHRLAPFSPTEVLSYLDRLEVGRSGHEDVVRLHQRSGGNPFYLGELLRAGAAPDGPTGTVTGLVRQRLAVLTGETRAVLELAAVVGTSFSVPVVARALGRPPVDVVALLEPAVTEGFVVLDAESARWRFVHDLAREALLGALPVARAAELHGRAGDAVADLHAGELDEHVDALADHRFRACLGVPSEEAFAACTVAADRASRRLSYDQAALHRGRALLCLPPGPDRRRERFEVLLRLTTERRAAGDVVGASASLQQAVELARLVDDRALLARAVAVLGGVTLWNWRQFEQVDHETVAVLEDLLDPAAAGPGPAGAEHVRRRVELLGTLAVELYYDDVRPHGEQHAVAAVRLARTTGDAALLGRALNNHVIAAWRPGRDADRLASLDESLALAGRGLPLATEVVARLHRASLRLAAADVAGSERDLERASRLAPRLGLVEVEGQVTAQHAGLALLRGDVAQAAELVERAHGQLARTSLWGADWVRLVQLMTRARLDQDVGPVTEALVAKASEDAHRPLRWTAVLALAEAGQLERARDLQARWGLRTLGRRSYWGSTFAWAQAAETSLLLGTPEPGAVYAALAPFAEQLVVAGTSVAVWGPVAGLLARLAEVRGEPAAAVRHARQAAALIRRVTAELGFSPTWPVAAPGGRTAAR